MLAAMAVAASLASCVPMRWLDAPLALLNDTPINCLLLEEPQWPLIGAIHQRQLKALAVAHDAQQALRAARTAADAVVTEGDFTAAVSKPVIALVPRRALRFDRTAEVTGTTQGVWPGIEI